MAWGYKGYFHLTLKFTFVLSAGTNPRLPRIGVGAGGIPRGKYSDWQAVFLASGGDGS